MGAVAELDISLRVEGYLEVVRSALSKRVIAKATHAGSEMANDVYRVITSRRFGHLGRRKSEPYRPSFEAALRDAIRHRRHLPFFYDLGPGYHAGIEACNRDLIFDVGLSELLALHQVVSFCNEVSALYAPGARFSLVIDNLCGLYTNDIPVARTIGYVARLRELIRAVDAEDLVSVMVESELFTERDYSSLLSRAPQQPLDREVSAAEIDNVARFLGRDCSREEARARIERYARTSIVTERLLQPHINGVRLTQRASSRTLGFRAFPGGDQRTQSGSLALTPGRNGSLKPVLLTTNNSADYRRMDVDIRSVLPGPLQTATYAVPAEIPP
jgi:hypothetical protein